LYATTMTTLAVSRRYDARLRPLAEPLRRSLRI
jgi:hypothetical protein